MNEVQVILADYVGKKKVVALANKIVEVNQREKSFEWNGNTWYIVDNQGEPEIRKNSTIIYEIKDILKMYLEEDEIEECFERLTNPATSKTAEKIDTFNVEGSECDCYAELLKYQPCTEKEEKFKRNLEKAISVGIKSFKVPVNDPSFSEDGKLQFIAGAKPAVRYSYNELEKIAKENALRLGTQYEYILFLATLIKRLIEEGWSKLDAWNAVCNDSKKLGHYYNSENAAGEFELTGSRMVAGKCDLANTYKMLAKDDEAGGFWIAGGDYTDNSNNFPLVDLSFHDKFDCHYGFSVGWFVL